MTKNMLYQTPTQRPHMLKVSAHTACFHPYVWGLLLSSLMYGRACTATHDVITLNGNNRPCNKTPHTRGLAKRPYVEAGLQSQCFHPLHPAESLMKSNHCSIENQRLSRGRMDLKVRLLGEKNTTVRGRRGETHPRLGGVSSADCWMNKIPWRRSPERECLFNKRMDIIPRKTDHCRGV